MQATPDSELIRFIFKIDGFLQRVSSRMPAQALPRTLLLEAISAMAAGGGAIFLKEPELWESFGLEKPERIRERLEEILQESPFPEKPLWLDAAGSAEIAAPVWRGGRPVGLLFVKNRQFEDHVGGFTADDKALLSALANSASVALEKAAVEEENRRLKTGGEPVPFITGNSPAMQEIVDRVNLITRQDINVSVLLEGETGTGKNRVARAIHNLGLRKDQPFVAVICANLEPQLAESQLFGHKKGAFTSAVSDHEGFIAAADKGVLFLDEISEIDLNLQAKLLGVLQDHNYQRLGETTLRHSDFQLICATNRNLAEEVKAGRFREDLYYRLKTFRLVLPPLRQRGDDIPLLVNHFVDKLNSESRIKQVQSVSSAAMRVLQQYAWPGNIRELEQVITGAFISCPGGTIGRENLDPALWQPGDSRKLVFNEVLPLEKAMAQYVKFAWEKTDHHKIRTMEKLGIAFRRLQRYLKMNEE
ncbi:MAG: sigma-54-dependent Fis family transcriptional regulator [Calditrichia bacterium]